MYMLDQRRSRFSILKIKRAFDTARALKRTNPVFGGIYSGVKTFAGPIQAHIDLTNRCNLRCICCWNRSPLLPESDRLPGWEKWQLEYDRVLGLVDELSAMQVKRIILSGGGDPLLYPRIFDVLRYVRSRGMSGMLVSSMTAAAPGAVQEILSSGADQLLVSLWASTPETYSKVHPGCSGEVFERVISLVGDLVARRRDCMSPELIIMNVITNLNFHEFPRMIDLAIRLGASRAWFQLVDVQVKSLRGLLLSREQLDSLVRSIDSAASLYEDRVAPWQRDILDFTLLRRRALNSLAPEGHYQTDFIDGIPCYMGWAETRILANGDVCPCCKADRHPLGNVHAAGFREIWDSPQYREFRWRAKMFPKGDVYFNKINCGRACDDWGLNEYTHGLYDGFLERLKGMGRWERLFWNLMVGKKLSAAITG